MSQRKEALGRIWTVLWQAVVGYLLLIVISILATVWMIVDVVWQLLLGSDGLSEDATPAKWVSQTLEWNLGQTLYAILGSGDGGWRPLPSS